MNDWNWEVQRYQISRQIPTGAKYLATKHWTFIAQLISYHSLHVTFQITVSFICHSSIYVMFCKCCMSNFILLFASIYIYIQTHIYIYITFHIHSFFHMLYVITFHSTAHHPLISQSWAPLVPCPAARPRRRIRPWRTTWSWRPWWMQVTRSRSTGRSTTFASWTLWPPSDTCPRKNKIYTGNRIQKVWGGVGNQCSR